MCAICWDIHHIMVLLFFPIIIFMVHIIFLTIVWSYVCNIAGMWETPKLTQKWPKNSHFSSFLTLAKTVHTIRTKISTVEILVRIVWTVLAKVENGCFLAIFGLILAMFLTSQPYDFDAIAHIGLLWARMTVENFVRIVWTVFEKIEKRLILG